MVQTILFLLLKLSSFALANTTIPSIEARVINMTQFNSNQIMAQMVGESTNVKIGAGNRVCTDVYSDYIPLKSEVYISPKLSIPRCKEGWGIGYRSRILFYIDPVDGEYNFPKSQISFDPLPKNYPSRIVLLEIPSTQVSVKMTDGSNALEWFESKRYPIFRLNVLNSQNKSIIDHYQSAILHSSTHPEFMLEEQFYTIANLDTESIVTVVTEVGMFGNKIIYSRNQTQMKLSELKPYLERLVIAIKP